MALIWADNFGMYGTTNDLLNGVYGTNTAVALVGGNDPAIFSNGTTRLRLPLPAPRTTVGQGGYIYLTELPLSDATRPSPITWKSSDNTFLFSIGVLPDGRIAVARGLRDNIIATTSSPVVTANASIHIEAKLVIDPVDGSIEVRVRGRTVILLENIDTGNIAIAQVDISNTTSNIGANTSYYWRHFTVWDDQGSVNNDFLGQVQVYWNQPVITREVGGWVSSAGALPHETLDKPSWANQLTSSGNIVNNDTVRIANTYYRWTSGSVDTGTPAGTSASPWLVALGVDTAGSLQNMYDAINASGVPGTTYSTALVEHPSVKGFGIIDTAFCVIPKVEGTTTMTFSETGAATAWTSTSTLLYRVWDPIRMSAGYTPAVKATGSITFEGQPSENDTITVHETTFTFKASPVAATDVAIGVDATETATNLTTALAQETVVTAQRTDLEIDLTAVSAGTSGNSIVLAETASNVTVSGASLSGGVNVTYPDPFVLGLTPLPDDVTSIRAIIPVVRAAKLDGGDGNIQTSFGTLDTNYDVGPDTPITNAFTYWGNATEPFVSEINPDTGTPWTPGEFNLGARVRVARTK